MQLSELWQEIITEAVTLIVIINPIGAATIFLSLTANQSPAERRRVALKSVLIAAVILIAFLIAGRILLSAMGISITAFKIGGGIVLLMFGLNMIFEFSTALKPSGDSSQGDVAIYPLAMPAIAGPGTIMTVVLLSDDDRYHLVGQTITVMVMLGVLLVTFGMFQVAMLLNRFVGASGAGIVKRVMGLLLCAVASDKILSGIAEYFQLATR
jgi:multiple antibiotic resistance protein